jgi:DNA transformation protein and related proteins
MSVQAQYLEYVLEQLGGLGTVKPRRMFGGVGLYRDELFFGLIDDDTLFFKTDTTNSAEYVARNMPRFMPPVNRPMGPMGYHQVPADIIEDADALVNWGRKAVAVALAAHQAKVMRSTRVRTPRKKGNATKRKTSKKKAANKESA